MNSTAEIKFEREPAEVIAELTHISGIPVESCFVCGQFQYINESMVHFFIRKGKNVLREIAFLKSAIKYEQDSPDTVLIHLPRFYAELFDLDDYILTDAETAQKLEHVRMFNAPRLKPRYEKMPEKIGNIRI